MQLKIVIAGLFIILLSACGGFIEKRKAIRNCDFSVADVKLENISAKEASLLFTLDVHNPNTVDVVVDKLSYELMIAGSKVAEGDTIYKLIIKQDETRPLKITIGIIYKGTYEAVLQIVRGKSINYELKGTIYLDTALGYMPFLFSITPKKR